jgi:hypothetical protein
VNANIVAVEKKCVFVILGNQQAMRMRHIAILAYTAL